MKPRLIGVGAIAIFAALISLIVYLHPIGRQIGPIRIKTIDDQTTELFGPTEDRIALVSFWASTCKPCIEEMPNLIRIYKDYEHEKFTMIGITMPYDPPNLTLAAVKYFSIPWPVALDIKGEWIKKFGDVSVTPTTLLIDRSGRVRWETRGPVDFSQLRRKIDKLLTDPA